MQKKTKNTKTNTKHLYFKKGDVFRNYFEPAFILLFEHMWIKERAIFLKMGLETMSIE